MMRNMWRRMKTRVGRKMRMEKNDGGWRAEEQDEEE